MQTLTNILQGISYRVLSGDDSMIVEKIEFDSRKVEKGTLFVAILGTVTDGHNFISKAIEQGCKAVVLQNAPSELVEGLTYIQVEDSAHSLGIMAKNFYNDPSSELKLIGVTGTNGKTTTVTLLYEVFTAMGIKCSLLSTVKNIVGDTVYPSTHTTPDALTLNAYLRQMVDSGSKYCFMEVSSHSLVQGRVEGITFAGAVFSNLTHDHLDYHKTFAAYRDAKKMLFDGLSKDAFALVNADDKNGMFMLQNTKARKYTYALSSLADFKAKILESTFDGMHLNIDSQDLWLSLVGRFNAYNALAVYGCSVLLEEDTTDTLIALSTQKGVRGRFESWISPTGVVCIVDYAHTPDAVLNVINTINDIRKHSEQFTAVVGCGGDRDKTKRPEMARIAALGADKTILTSDNPRSEDPEYILSQMQEGVPAERFSRVITITDRRQAIRCACMNSSKGDIVLVAGKGHETYQEVKGVRTHFDDLEEIKNCFV